MYVGESMLLNEVVYLRCLLQIGAVHKVCHAPRGGEGV